MSIIFEDYSVEVKAALDDALNRGLEEAGIVIEGQAASNTPVDTGQLKGSWDHIVDEGAKKVTIGSPLENAIWTEFGTGEHSIKGGRRGGWVYRDKKTGKFYHTYGKPSVRMLHNAFNTKKTSVKRVFEQILKGRMG